MQPAGPDDLGGYATTADLLAGMRAFITRHELSDATAATYQGHLDRFTAWCVAHGLSPLPAQDDTVLLWVLGQLRPTATHDGVKIEGLRTATIRVGLAAIAHAHRVAGLPDPTGAPFVNSVLDAADAIDDRPRRTARPLGLPELEAIDATLPEQRGPTWQRDRDLVVVAFFGAFGSEDLRSLDVSGIAIDRDQARLLLPASSVNPTRPQPEVVIAGLEGHPRCPIAALVRLLDATPGSGPLLPSPRNSDRPVCHRTINDAVRRVTDPLPPDPNGLAFSSQSMRRGFLAAARAQGASLTSIGLKARISTWDGVVHAVSGPPDTAPVAVLNLLELTDR